MYERVRVATSLSAVDFPEHRYEYLQYPNSHGQGRESGTRAGHSDDSERGVHKQDV